MDSTVHRVSCAMHGVNGFRLEKVVTEAYKHWNENNPFSCKTSVVSKSPTILEYDILSIYQVLGLSNMAITLSLS